MPLQFLAHRTAFVASVATSILLGMQALAQAKPLETAPSAASASSDALKLSNYVIEGNVPEGQSVASQSNALRFATDTTFQVNEQIALAQFTAPSATLTEPEQPVLDIASQTQLPIMDVASADVKQVQDVTTSSTPSYGFSYVGGAINIGLGSGRTGLGQTSFAIISKLGITDYLSFRPSILFTDNLTVLLPVTYDFRGRKVGGSTVLPFLGAGVAAATRNGTSFELLLTAGVDVPVSKEITITGSLNATVTGGSSLGLLLGIAYNFE